MLFVGINIFLPKTFDTERVDHFLKLYEVRVYPSKRTYYI